MESRVIRIDTREFSVPAAAAGMTAVAKNFSVPWHRLRGPAAMRRLSIRSSSSSPRPCRSARVTRDSRTNKSAGVFCFAKRPVKRAAGRNRPRQAGKKVNDRSFIVLRVESLLSSPSLFALSSLPIVSHHTQPERVKRCEMDWDARRRGERVTCNFIEKIVRKTRVNASQ